MKKSSKNRLPRQQVYTVILKNEDWGPNLLGKIKSQGVRQMDDSVMVMRVKYKTIPGDQFAIRKEVCRLLQEAFKNEGIECVYKNVTVYISPETSQQLDPKDGESRKKIIEAAAASVLTEEGGSPANEKISGIKNIILMQWWLYGL